MNVSIKEVRDRIGSVSNTKKITEAMKLVAAAKVRRAQEAVVNGRPFAENLVKVGAGRFLGVSVSGRGAGACWDGAGRMQVLEACCAGQPQQATAFGMPPANRSGGLGWRWRR